MTVPPPDLHRVLVRQLRRLALTPDAAPDVEQWRGLVRVVSEAYTAADSDRYTMERSLELSSEEMRALHEVLSRSARCDALTGLPNRAALLEVLAESLAALQHAARAAAVLFIDLDGFKLVNDSLGHEAGDQLLVRAAERIQAVVRDGDVVARLGGDEFVVLCPDVLSVDTAVAVGARVVSQLEVPFRLGLQEAVVTASVGIALTTASDRTAEDVLRKADAAMYEAKSRGRSQHVVFDEDMRSRAQVRLDLQTALRHALRAGELVLHHQPVVALDDGRVTGLEALVRWDRPGHGLLLPETFLATAEESRLVTAIDTWVVHQAARSAVQWADADLHVAVNLSVRDLLQRDVVEAVASALHETGLRPRRLVLEVTEAVLMSDNAVIAHHLGLLRSMGAQLAIDDFGTGYSALTSLRRVPAQVLKIDPSFVATVDQDDAGAAIVGAIVTMAHALGMEVVAEGVERPGQVRALRRLGCDAGQGHLFSPPVPADEVPALLARDLAGHLLG